jgi:hypothetical protein
MAYEWKIISVEAPDGELITEARYHVSLEDTGKVVETEGNWFFRDYVATVPFANVTEEMVVEWIKQATSKDGRNQIEARLDEQMFEIRTKQDVVAPWLPQVFTPQI